MVSLKDPTIHRWKKGWVAIFLDTFITAIIAYLIFSPIKKFGTVALQTNVTDEEKTVFEFDFEKHLKTVMLDV